MGSRGILSFTLAALYVVCPAGAGAATLYVNPNGSGDFTTIQAAINAAAAGTVIIAAAGVYPEHISFMGKAVTLQSADPLDPDTVTATVINGTDNGTCVSFSNGEGAGSVLQGLTIRNGFAYQSGGGVYCLGASPTISDCVFKDNWGNSSGGGICNMSGSHPKISRCTFIANVGEDFGGGIYNYPGCSPTITNCLFIDNYVGVWNGRDAATTGSPLIVNCTFARNIAYGIVNFMSSTSVANSILWDTTPIYNGGVTPGVLYCDVRGGWGTNNINADPGFVSTASDDFRLLPGSPGSPCIDAGSNSLVPTDITTDRDGAARFYNDPNTPDTGEGTLPVVDMGAYEYHLAYPVCGDAQHPILTADLNRDCIIDLEDLAYLCTTWLVCTKPECD